MTIYDLNGKLKKKFEDAREVREIEYYKGVGSEPAVFLFRFESDRSIFEFGQNDKKVNISTNEICVLLIFIMNIDKSKVGKGRLSYNAYYYSKNR